MNKDRFFFFGFGQTAKYLIKNLEQSTRLLSIARKLYELKDEN